jgi:Major tropism determinant N-terminal domain
MSVQVQWRRGTSSQIAAFKGAAGEIAVDTTNNRVVVQDGSTTGGFPAAKLAEVPVAPSPNGAAAAFSYIEQLMTCSGATTNIPLGATVIIMAVSLRVITTVTGCTSITVNDSQNGNGHWGSGIGLAAGTTNAGVASPGPYYNGSTTLALAAVGGGASFTGGTIRVSVLAMTVNPPAS